MSFHSCHGSSNDSVAAGTVRNLGDVSTSSNTYDVDAGKQKLIEKYRSNRSSEAEIDKTFAWLAGCKQSLKENNILKKYYLS